MTKSPGKPDKLLPNDINRLSNMTTMQTASSTSTTSAASMATSTTPKRGNSHVDYGIYLGAEELDDDWNLILGNHFQYANQCCNINAFGTINKTLTEARESETILKFQGKLEPNTGIEKELDKQTFILTGTQLIAQYTQEQFYYFELNNKVMNVLENHDYHAKYK